MRINHNISAINTFASMEANSSAQSKSLEKLSSGLRINRAGDDAAGLAISKNVEAEIRGLRQASRNANDGVSYVQTAEGGLNEVSNLLIRLRELGVQAGSDSVGDEERSFINREYQSLKQEIERISQVTSFNGRYLLNGSGDELSFQVGIHKGENDVIRFRADESNSSTRKLGLGGAGVASKGDALDSLETVDMAIRHVNEYRATLGALQNRLHSASNNLSTQIENLSEARSRISDTDIAEEASKLARSNVLQSAGIAVLAQANASPQVALRLL